MLHNRVTSVLWPAFLMAGVLEILVFALIDPQDLHWQGLPLGWSRQTVYTAAFFVFWGITSASGALTLLLSLSPDEVNS